MKFGIALTALALAASFSGVATAQQIGSVQQGRSVAETVCAECHGIRKGDRSPNSLAPTFPEVASTRGMSEMALRVWLRSPHRNMPNIVVKDEDRESVIAYILSLK